MHLKRNLLLLSIKIILSLVLIYFLIESGRLDLSLFNNIKQQSYLISAVIIALLNILLVNFRWYYILKESKLELTFIESLKLTIIGIFLNYTLPGSTSGELVKGLVLGNKKDKRYSQTMSSVFIDQLIGLFTMLLFGILTLLFNYQLMIKNIQLKSVFFVLGLIILAIILVITQAKNFESFFDKIPFLKKFKSFFTEVITAFNNKKLLIVSIGISLIVQFTGISFMYCVGIALDVKIPLDALFFAVPIGFVISAIPITPGGVGWGQVAFYSLFSLYLGEDVKVGQLGITAFQVVMFALSLVGVLLITYFNKNLIDAIKGSISRN